MWVSKYHVNKKCSNLKLYYSQINKDMTPNCRFVKNASSSSCEQNLIKAKALLFTNKEMTSNLKVVKKMLHPVHVNKNCSKLKL